MYQMKALGVLSIFILLLTTNSCNEAKKVINLVSDVQLNGSYAIVNIGGEVVSSDDTKKVFIAFNSTDKSIRGNTGCNSYFGNYMLDQYSMSFSDIGQTEMACEEAVMRTEWNLMQALRDTGSFTLVDNILTLYSITDRSILLTAKREVKEGTDNGY